MPALAPAFAHPVRSAQTVFRTIMDAFAHPGTINGIEVDLVPPSLLATGTAAIALTLLDYETPVWLDPSLSAAADVAQWIRFHTGAHVTNDPSKAAFALVADGRQLPLLQDFALGTMEYPDRSTTVIVQVESLTHGRPLALAGPGISGSRAFSVSPLPEDFTERLSANRSLFPRGVDLLFVAANAVAALPRSTRVTQGG